MRSKIIRLSLACLVVLSFGATAWGQAWRVARDRIQPHWFDDGRQLWYRVELPDHNSQFIHVDAVTGKRTPAFDHDAVARGLSAITGNPVSAGQLPIQSVEFDADGKSILLHSGQHAYRLTRDNNQLASVPSQPAEASDALFLPTIPSSDDGQDVEISVTNRLQKAVQLLWCDRDRKLHPYHVIEAGATVKQHTFVGHVWLLQRDNEPIGCFVAKNDPTNVVLDEALTKRVEQRGPSNDPAARKPRDKRRGPRNARSQETLQSPDGQFEAFVRDDDLWIRKRMSEESEREREFRLTDDASPDHSFRRHVPREQLDELKSDAESSQPGRPRTWWSPDSQYVLAFQTKHVSTRVVQYVESSPPDQIQPKVGQYAYAKPGDPLPTPTPRLFRLADRQEIPISTALFPNPFEFRFERWSDDGKSCYFLYNERGHQRLRVLELRLETGAIRSVVDETSQTFIHYSSEGKFELRWLSSGQLLWASERSGWNHLYRYDLATGTVVNAVTQGEWNVRRIEQIDEERGVVWFYAVGMRAGQDPYHEHFCRVRLDGTQLTILTEGDGTHSIEWSPHSDFIVDRYSRVDMPAVTELRRGSDGGIVCVLERGEIVPPGPSANEAPRPLPERFVAKGRDGKTDIWGIIHRPRSFDRSKKYPVVENIYAGPHSFHVPKTFHQAYGHQQRIADAGAIVVQIDGMGTAWRSKSFHDVCYRNLRDAGFLDRIAWMRAAAEKYPEFDLTRVGIYGGSAGGQNAMAALLWHGDFYRVAVADCGCHDNRMDKIWWNEQWMGEVGDGRHYAENSNTEHAHLLQGKLMLVVGELDRNVDPASTTQVVGRLIRANKDFEFLLVVGAGHGACEGPYASRRRLEFLQRHLEFDRE